MSAVEARAALGEPDHLDAGLVEHFVEIGDVAVGAACVALGEDEPFGGAGDADEEGGG
jgi:hypothetical protein